jgi:beta-N-acetylhexosaminidase
MGWPACARRGLTLGGAVLLLGLGACTAPAADPAPPTVSSPAPASPAPSSRSTTPSPSAPPSATATSSATVAPSATPTPTPPGCARLVSRLSLPERVGQLLMVAVTSTGVSRDQTAAVRATQAGSVLLLGNSTAGTAAVRRLVTDVRAAAPRPQRIGTLLAADQEGGLVQRLRGPGFADIPAAIDQAELSDAALARRARGWGNQLDRAGIDANLAPVADVVPKDLVQVNEPIGRLRRGYGASPRVVAAKVRAFSTGMDRAGVATAVKHFPGLGRVRGNTDTTSGVVDPSTTRHDAALRGFRAAVQARVDMVMVSSASYPRIDARRRAVFSPVVLDQMLRGDLGFAGVVISDDLAAVALRDVPAGQRAVRFLAAGGDLAIVGNPAEARAMASALRTRAERDPDFATRVDASAARVLRMKQRRGLVRCEG